MRTFLNHMKNETLDEIKTSLENLWQRMIQLSEFFQYSFVLILKRKCLVGASGVRRGESGTPSTIIYTRWSSWRYELGCDAPVIMMTLSCLLPEHWPHGGFCVAVLHFSTHEINSHIVHLNSGGSTSYVRLRKLHSVLEMHWFFSKTVKWGVNTKFVFFLPR